MKNDLSCQCSLTVRYTDRIALCAGIVMSIASGSSRLLSGDGVRVSLRDAAEAVSPNGPSWQARGRPVRTLYVLFMIIFAMISIGGIVGFRVYPHPVNDFFAFRSFSRFIHQNVPATIYQQDLLRRFQHLPNNKLFAFMYHPGMMLLIWPLADLPYNLGYMLWVGIGLVACAIVLLPRGRPFVLLMIAAPSTLWTALCGQSSLLAAALVVGGLGASARRPLLGGVLLGFAAYKPQLGVLVPIALLAARRWHTIASAATTVLCIVLLSSAAFGLAVWPTWFASMPSIMHVSAANGTNWAPLMATVTSNLTMLGIGPRVAGVGQLLSSGFCALLVWRCFRCGSGDLEIAVLGAATFLATPFAFTYDMPLFTAAILLFAAERYRRGGVFLYREVLIVIAALLLPYCVLIDWLHACGSLIVLLMIWAICWRLRALRADVRSGATHATTA